MKKIFLFIATLLLSTATQAALHVYAFPIDSTLTEDTYMQYSEFEEDFGEIVAEVRLRVFSDDTSHITVKINRSDTLFLDNFCAGQNCMSSNEELEQVIEYDIPSAEERNVYLHCYAHKEGSETISYTFSDGFNSEITLTVEFVYQATALEQTHCNPTAKGIYTVLGQRVLATSIDELPKGIYIVNGKKVVKQ